MQILKGYIAFFFVYYEVYWQNKSTFLRETSLNLVNLLDN